MKTVKVEENEIILQMSKKMLALHVVFPYFVKG